MILRKLLTGRFSEVCPFWDGHTVVIIGGGPSLTLEQVDKVRIAHWNGKAHCIAVNDAYLLAPWADVQYAADYNWHVWHTEGIERPGMKAFEVKERWLHFQGQKCSIEQANGSIQNFEDVHLLRNRTYPNHGWGLSRDPKSISTGRNSGFQALNIATLAGAQKIILIGFDGKPGEKAHWFGDHPKATPASAYALYREAMAMAEEDLRALGVEVLNCSPGSAIDSFKKVDLEGALRS